MTIERLVERNRVSKPLEGYTQNTQNMAALKRAREQDLAVHPGQDIEYVVVDDENELRWPTKRLSRTIRPTMRQNWSELSKVSYRLWVGSIEDPSETRGHTGAGVDDVRGF